jgi:hypothetical protein
MVAAAGRHALAAGYRTAIDAEPFTTLEPSPHITVQEA